MADTKGDANSGLVIMIEKQEKKPLFSQTIVLVRPGERIMSDRGENWVICVTWKITELCSLNPPKRKLNSPTS
jgi:hypothetical protein